MDFSFIFNPVTVKPIYPELAHELHLHTVRMNLHRRERNIVKALGLGLLVAASLVPVQAQSQGSEPAFSRDRPLYEMDLRKYGFAPLVSGRRDFLSLDFADANRLVFAWTTADNPRADKKKGPHRPSHLHAVFLDARTGQEQDIREWPSSSFYATIYPVRERKFLICTGNAVRLLSREFDVVHEETPPSSTSCLNNQISPSGRSFSVASGVGADYHATLMDVESFQPLATWSNEAMNVHFTDTFLVGSCRPDFEVCIRKLGQPWEPFHFAGTDQQMKDSKPKFAVLVNQSAMVIGTAKELAVVTVEGTLVFPLNLPTKLFAQTTRVSPGGDRFVVLLGRMRGLRNERLDMSPLVSDDHLVVYSLTERKAIYALKVKGDSPWPSWTAHDHRNLLALSPDGALLALVNDGMLTVYRLPAGKS